PQFGLARLLAGFGAGRQGVRWLAGKGPSTREAARLHFLAEALRPAATTSAWSRFARTGEATAMARSLTGISEIEAPGPEAEAAAISLILREAIETPGRTAALVTPDRNLGRRVAAELERWGLRVDDSAGRPFAKTVQGAFLDLVLGALETDFAPVETMALLKHPLTRLGLAVGPARKAARALELLVFRRDYLGSGLGGIRTALAAARNEHAAGRLRHPVVRRLTAADVDNAGDLLGRLEKAYEPLTDIARFREPAPLSRLSAAHARVAEAIAAREEASKDVPPIVWSGEAGEMAAELFQKLADSALPQMRLATAEYPDLYRGIVADLAVRLSVSLHPRLFIWGPFEARLMQPDIVVLGGLNEGAWPQAADPGPWLNRQMRSALGLPSPEERIGHEAHDLCSLLGAPRVVLTRSAKADGNPTVPSRWLLRINALLAALGRDPAGETSDNRPWLEWAGHKNRIVARETINAPAPAPPVSLRPRSLSVSDIETWIGNPYAIFARRILRLEPLPPLAAEPGPALRGTLIHQALHRFTGLYPGVLPENASRLLTAILDDLLREHAAHPRIAAFWRPRFRRFAEWFA
ncbi:MAG: double-strand break repair protein AddB, partial [Hyphomicrobiaceae bacterium]